MGTLSIRRDKEFLEPENRPVLLNLTVKNLDKGFSIIFFFLWVGHAFEPTQGVVPHEQLSICPEYD